MAFRDEIGLIFGIKSDYDGSGIDKAQNDIANFDSTATSSLGGVAKAAGIAASAITGIAGVASTVGAGLFAMAKQASDFGSAIFDASEKTGLGAERLSALKVAAETSGSSFDALINGVGKFAVEIGKANDGNDKAAANMKALSVTSLDLDTALAQAFKTINDATPGVEQNNAAVKAFGRAGKELIPTIKAVDGDIEKWTAEMKRLGLTMDEDGIRKSDAFGDQMDILGKQVLGVRNTIGVELMPVFTNMAGRISEWLADNKHEVKDWATSWSNGITDVADTMQGLQMEASKPGGFWAMLGAVDEFILKYTAVGQLGKAARADAQDAQKKTARSAFDLSNPDSFELDPTTNTLRAKRPKNTPIRPDGLGEIGSGSGSATTKTKAKADSDDRSDKQAYKDFVKELKNVGISINSGYRTFEEQRKLFLKYGPGQAARPGTSSHEFYKGLDLPANADMNKVRLAAQRAGVVLDKPNFHQGSGWHNHQGFRKGKNDGSGERDLAEEQQKAAEAAADRAEKEAELAKEIRDLEIEYAGDVEKAKFEIGQRTTDFLISEQERLAKEAENVGDDAGQIEAIKEAGRLRIQLIQDEITELMRLYDLQNDAATKAEAAAKKETDPLKRGPLLIDAMKKRAEASKTYNDIEAKTIELQTTEAKVSDDVLKSIQDVNEAREETNRILNERLETERELNAERDHETLLDTSIKPGYGADGMPNVRPGADGEVESTDEEGGVFGGWLQSWRDYRDEILEDAPTVSDTINEMGGMALEFGNNMKEAVGQAVEQWVLYGDSVGKALRMALAAELAHIAGRAAIKAIELTAEGFALLAFGQFDKAASAFTSAAMYAALAVGAGLAGRALAPKQDNKSAAKSFAGSAAQNGPQRQQTNVAGQGEQYSGHGDKAAKDTRQANNPTKIILEIRPQAAFITDTIVADYNDNGVTRQLVMNRE